MRACVSHTRCAAQQAPCQSVRPRQTNNQVGGTLQAGVMRKACPSCGTHSLFVPGAHGGARRGWWWHGGWLMFWADAARALARRAFPTPVIRPGPRGTPLLPPSSPPGPNPKHHPAPHALHHPLQLRPHSKRTSACNHRAYTALRRPPAACAGKHPRQASAC